MKYPSKRLTLSVLLALAAFPTLGIAAAKYKGEDRGRPVMPTQTNTRWQTECGSCHLAFPPGLLPAASLEKHFDTDASLSAPDNQAIGTYLSQHASNRWTSTASPIRITDSGWFKAKHSAQEINPAVWQRAAIKSPANCMACHPAANKGDFNERNIRIPK